MLVVKGEMWTPMSAKLAGRVSTVNYILLTATQIMLEETIIAVVVESVSSETYVTLWGYGR